MTGDSGVKFAIDATDGATRYLHVRITVSPPFNSKKLTLKFPRWVPGSYFIREPMQYLTGISCHQNGIDVKFNRKAVDSVDVKINDLSSDLVINYKILGIELSVRSTHIDNSHLHMMPPFTFLLPTSGIDKSRMDMTHQIELYSPTEWTPATQLKLESKDLQSISLIGNKANMFTFSAPDRDHLLDGIMEVNANENINFKVDGRNHVLKLWDSGNFQPDNVMVNRFIEDMKKIIKEYHALFGVPEWGEYVTVLQLTEKSRGGLEHLNSQTSMLPRVCLIDGFADEYRDLISLFSHEYMHQWNVKRLRPKNFIHYDLQQEIHTDLLWWFEGCTSWLGDMLCVRSGAWSEEDWRKDMERKLARHTIRNGSNHESLAESSHDAWIHLYRSHSFSREIQISYYLEGELAIFCIDAELRKRSKGEHGICDLMVKLCEKYALGYPNAIQMGVDYKDIRKELVNMAGGRNLGKYLDSLVFEKSAPDVGKALEYYGLSLKSKITKDNQLSSSWLGLNLSEKGGKLLVSSHQADSPLRQLIMPGDELISINRLRINSVKSLKSILQKLDPSNVEICYSHEGVINFDKIDLRIEPELKNKLDGKGNAKWRDYIASRII
jgi:predicted metalloprotease with PDZ domain